MISEIGKFRSCVLLVSILISGPLFHLFLFDWNENQRRISYNSVSPNSKFKGERGSEKGEEHYERFDQSQKENRFVKIDIMNKPSGPDGYEESTDGKDSQSLKAWQEEEGQEKQEEKSFKAWKEEQEEEEEEEEEQ